MSNHDLSPIHHTNLKQALLLYPKYVEIIKYERAYLACEKADKE
jgi:hypothetical protein